MPWGIWAPGQQHTKHVTPSETAVASSSPPDPTSIDQNTAAIPQSGICVPPIDGVPRPRMWRARHSKW